jgi:hypothetical protein
MKKYQLAFAVALLIVCTSPATNAAGVSQHFSEALVHSLQAVGDSMAAGTKLAFAVVAVPLMVGGEIGKVSGQVGEELWNEANRPIGAPLDITGDVVTAGPRPAEAMNQGGTRP